jgi:molybdopterin-guanine dinucleotide biosynthesis protein A
MSGNVSPGYLPSEIGAVVLAGGQALRMGGVDKGLQHYGHQTLLEHALERLRAQSGGPPGMIAINANRNQEAYAQFGCPVWPDAMPGYQGPLAGFLSALEQNALCASPKTLVLTVPCDSPLFPLDLLNRLWSELTGKSADIAVACGPETGSNGTATVRRQPVFCLMRTNVQDNLTAYMRNGGRKIDSWMQQHATVDVVFDRPTDSANAFFNANTLDELKHTEAP